MVTYRSIWCLFFMLSKLLWWPKKLTWIFSLYLNRLYELWKHVTTNISFTENTGICYSLLLSVAEHREERRKLGNIKGNPISQRWRVGKFRRIPKCLGISGSSGIGETLWIDWIDWIDAIMRRTLPRIAYILSLGFYLAVLLGFKVVNSVRSKTRVWLFGWDNPTLPNIWPADDISASSADVAGSEAVSGGRARDELSIAGISAQL